MEFSDAFFRALALVGVALLLCSVPAQRDLLGQPYRHGHSSSCALKQCPYPDKGICIPIDVRPGSDACGAEEEFEHLARDSGGHKSDVAARRFGETTRSWEPFLDTFAECPTCRPGKPTVLRILTHYTR